MKQAQKTFRNKRFGQWLTLAFCLALGSVAVFLYAYTQARDENLALRIKLKTLAEQKRKPVPTRLGPAEDSGTGSGKAAQEQVEESSPGEISLRSMTNLELARRLDRLMANFGSTDLPQVERGIEMAQEMMDRNRLDYSAHKAKLILMLVKEAKFGEEINENELEFLLSEMARFEIRPEDRLFVQDVLDQAQTAAQDEAYQRRMENTENEYNLTLLELEGASPGSALEESLLERADLLEDRLERLESQQEQALDIPARNELVEIPLQRALAKGDYATVIDESLALLDWFPDSVSAHYYYIRAMRLSGREEEALGFLSDAGLGPRRLEELARRLAAERDPREYWRYLEY